MLFLTGTKLMKYLKIRIILLAALSVATISNSLSAAEKIHAGVAANYIQVFKELSAVYEKNTGTKVEATFTSSGSLYGQITNGAPYDIFLSADEERPLRLFNEGLAAEPFVYAKGEVILWSAKKDFCKSGNWVQALKIGSVKKISMANPVTAPYGMSAMKALEKTGIYESVKPLIVNSQDIAQAFQYVSNEAVDAGFCALSAVYTDQGRAGCYYKIKEAPFVVQSACVLKSSKKVREAEKFAAFLVSKEALKIKEKYGYK
jgi:molybdate transport system substrate-binding protein